jgi:hypothetical protein
MTHRPSAVRYGVRRNGLSSTSGCGAEAPLRVGCQKAPGLMPWMAWRRSSSRSCFGPPLRRWKATAAMALAMIGMPMQAPRRCADGKMGSWPAIDTAPPVAARVRLTVDNRSSSAVSGSKAVTGLAARKMSVSCGLILSGLPLRPALRARRGGTAGRRGRTRSRTFRQPTRTRWCSCAPGRARQVRVPGGRRSSAED